MRNQINCLPVFVCAIILATASPAISADEAVALSLEEQTALRCSAAFAIVANDQAAGDPKALAYPSMQQRGREFMVRSAAKLMDDKGLTREQIALLLAAEAAALREQDQLTAIMGPCLSLLDASGL